ncbi:retrovirus-related pol polyprotein from transposon TNT 1-94 [Tanacetum coccineum]
MLNELSNDGVNLNKLEINVGFVNILLEKWLNFSQGLRHANHTQTPDLDFQENSNDEADERTSEEYLKDLELQFHKRALLENLKRLIKKRNNFSSQEANENTDCYKCGKKGHFARDCFFKTSEPSYKSPVLNFSSFLKGFQPKFTPKLIQSSQPAQSSQNEPKIQKDYKVEYKKKKAKLALLEASSSTSQSLNTFQSKNKGLVAETFDWKEEEVSIDEEMTYVKVLMALADDELSVGKNHIRNGEWIDIALRKRHTRDPIFLVFIHNYKDHLGKFNAKADDRYFLGYSFVSKAFRVFNTMRQQIKKTYHVTFDESMEAIRFTNTLVDEIGIDDSSRYPPDEFLHEDYPSRQYQANSNFSYYIIPHDTPHTKDVKDPLDLTNTEGIQEQNVQVEQINSQPTKKSLGNYTETSLHITESLVPKVIQSQSMLTRSMAAKLTAALASECLFADFLSEIEPKKMSKTLKHP